MIKLNWKETIDKIISRNPFLEEMYIPLRAKPMLRRYRNTRERYETICVRKGLIYSEEDIRDSIADRLKNRGYTPVRREIGNVHTFGFIPLRGWHHHLLPDLKLLGPTTLFNYHALGYKASDFYGTDVETIKRNRERMNALFLKEIKLANDKNKIDWIFCYATANDLDPDAIKKIQEDYGIPVVVMCLDDKQSWKGTWLGSHFGGQVDIATLVDLSWTSARVACTWYLARGGRPIYLPEGCNPRIYRPLLVEQDIDVSFIGVRYGFRNSTVRFLKRYGISIQSFGPGWGTRAVWGEDAVRIICRSKINLGMGGIGYSEALTNVKTRDLEIAATGGGLYITSYNPDLALHFHIGREIVCYRNRDEMLELIRYYLSHPDEAKEIALAGRQRCLKEHRWLHRYVKICQVLGLLDDSLTPVQLVAQQLSNPDFAEIRNSWE